MPEMLNLKKVFGQNFIRSSEVVDDIIRTIDADKDCFVIEIGPGDGALTVPLAPNVGHLAAIEIDKRLVKMLREEFADDPHVKIVFDDVLQTDFKEILEHEQADRFPRLKIAGNIPYNITSPIITKVLSSGLPFENFTLMIQKEVAERICAKPGKRAYGYMSVFVQYYTEAEYIRTVGRELFLPVPNVDSAVVNLTFRKEAPVDCDKEKFFNTVKQCFAHKRKTLANNLIGYAGSDKTAVSQFLNSIGIDPKRRAETLSLDEFAKIANAVGQGNNQQVKPAETNSSEISKW